MHKFENSHRREQKTSREPFVSIAYEKYVADVYLKGIIDTQWIQNGRQERGIDKILTLSDGSKLAIEEKFRYRGYNDIALEIYSSFENKAPGWAVKEIEADIVAYWIVPDHRVLIFNSNQLRSVLREHRTEWERLAATRQNGFRYADAKNPTYTTRSLCVPLIVMHELLDITEIRVN